MCECAVATKREVGISSIVKRNSWRLNKLFKIEGLIKECKQDARAKRMGICGNTIFVKAIKGDISSVLFEPQVRCKDRVCPVCNAYRSSVLSRKVEKLGLKMSNPHMLTITANSANRNSLKNAIACFKNSTSLLKKNRSWWKKYVKGGIEHIEVTYKIKNGWHVHSHILLDLNIDRYVENMRFDKDGVYVDPIKRELENILFKVGLGTISDIRPVTNGYGKEISKYALKYGLNMPDERLKEFIIDMRGKRMVSTFGNCYGQKEDDLEELSEEERTEYSTYGTLDDVVEKAFSGDGVDPFLIDFVYQAVKIGLIELGVGDRRYCSKESDILKEPEKY